MKSVCILLLLRENQSETFAMVGETPECVLGLYLMLKTNTII